MAERYPSGENRIFYRSIGFREGIVVTMDIISPSLSWNEGILLTEVGKGLYFLDFDFYEDGTYGAVVYENGQEVISQTYLISDEPIGIREDIKVLVDDSGRLPKIG